MADIPLDKLVGTDRNSWISSVVMCAVTALGDRGFDTEPLFERCRADRALDVRLVIHGLEVPAEFFFERYGPEWDAHVDRRARELLEERMGEKLRAIDDNLDDIKRASRSLGREHFPLWFSEDCE